MSSRILPCLTVPHVLMTPDHSDTRTHARMHTLIRAPLCIWRDDGRTEKVSPAYCQGTWPSPSLCATIVFLLKRNPSKNYHNSGLSHPLLVIYARSRVCTLLLRCWRRCCNIEALCSSIEIFFCLACGCDPPRLPTVSVCMHWHERKWPMNLTWGIRIVALIDLAFIVCLCECEFCMCVYVHTMCTFCLCAQEWVPLGLNLGHLCSPTGQPHPLLQATLSSLFPEDKNVVNHTNLVPRHP